MAEKQFTEENQIFDANLDQWIKAGRLGAFVVINGKNQPNFYSGASEAFSAGIEKFGLGNFFMKQVLPKDTVNVTFLGLAI